MPAWTSIREKIANCSNHGCPCKVRTIALTSEPCRLIGQLVLVFVWCFRLWYCFGGHSTPVLLSRNYNSGRHSCRERILRSCYKNLTMSLPVRLVQGDRLSGNRRKVGNRKRFTEMWESFHKMVNVQATFRIMRNGAFSTPFLGLLRIENLSFYKLLFKHFDSHLNSCKRLFCKV